MSNTGSTESLALYVEAEKFQGGFAGCLPVRGEIKAGLNTGWRGLWLYNVFYEESMSARDWGAPRFGALAGKGAHERIIEELRRDRKPE